jgi:hypothetical protein
MHARARFRQLIAAAVLQILSQFSFKFEHMMYGKPVTCFDQAFVDIEFSPLFCLVHGKHYRNAQSLIAISRKSGFRMIRRFNENSKSLSESVGFQLWTLVHTRVSRI